ncbi:MAG: hypothetical protein R3Y08_08160 [Rikenellaceae bacterium]
MENNDTLKFNNPDAAEHEMMLNEVYKGDVELLYLDCCFGELLRN